ncbi:2'-5' RNA ligase [Parafrankia irregularis]|uniref:RNA 2',3'-cyclic phosphodiesterase n=1 Tax=Parafrankia irregularis TaxID=795642 RepID=A0A0S4QP07_9ACTN|nr:MULTISPECIES: RNA 2',3'-cyclic phosphodiesterase [Parafrankia]MBE3204228.1 RNA 2',3'-cyclic phosphodiesterase [Parafrankia sp. CH37]CUU57197.1 2'-5' RNA ligase [Parafrankia irregularis]
MRYFVALLPPPEVVDGLAAAIARVSGRPEPRLRWSSPPQWHVTLAFLGPVDPAVRPALAERLGRVARRHPPVEVRLDGAGHFGGRVLWARVNGDLGPLATGVRRAAARAGADHGDDRPFRAHLTLARVPAGTSPDLREVVRELDEAIAGSSWSAGAITLMSSDGGPAPTYRVESEWELRGSAASR